MSVTKISNEVTQVNNLCARICSHNPQIRTADAQIKNTLRLPVFVRTLTQQDLSGAGAALARTEKIRKPTASTKSYSQWVVLWGGVVYNLLWFSLYRARRLWLASGGN